MYCDKRRKKNTSTQTNPIALNPFAFHIVLTECELVKWQQTLFRIETGEGFMYK